MGSGGETSVMRRKAGAGRPAPEIARMDAARALKLAFVQAAEEAAALVANVLGVRESRTTLSAQIGDMPECPLLALVNRSDGATGLVVLDADSLASLIEAQTTGRVVPRPAAARVPTRTDAQLASGFIDLCLELFGAIAAEAGLEVAPMLTGFRYDLPLADARAVEMTLPEIAYRRFEVQVDYGDGAKKGVVRLLLPYENAAVDKADSSASWQRDLQQVVECAEVELEAILARKSMLLGEVAKFSPGTLIPLPNEVIGQVRLRDLEGRDLSLATLGQSAGFRALQITAFCCAREAEAALPGAAPGEFGQPDMAAGQPGADAATGGMPGEMPGEMPVTMPGEMPGEMPGSTPGDLAIPAETPPSAPAQAPPPGASDLPDLPDMAELPDLASL